jgi:hypothetical protein
MIRGNSIPGSPPRSLPLLTSPPVRRSLPGVAGKFRLRLLCVLLLLCGVQNLSARDAFVVISGGGSPLDDNYSQYLQARALSGYFLSHHSPDSVWVFFGAGNVEGQAPVICDVHRQKEQNGFYADSWLTGALPRNQPARRDIILGALRDQILPTVADGGTLYLFVGDHGSRTSGHNAESIITLWTLIPDAASEGGWRANDDESLGVAELRRVLTRGIGKGRVVFCMTQCHSGGFHYLGIPHNMTADPTWFTRAPAWAGRSHDTGFPPAAGFTATDEFSVAAGCDPDPDPENWAGYERLLPESLIGRDLLTQRPIGEGVGSFAEAHVAATLSDFTIDMPRSTSDQYLACWADLIELRLENAAHLTSTARKALSAYERTVDGEIPQLPDAAFTERQKQFHRYVEAMAQQDGGLRRLLVAGSRAQLENALDPSLEEGAGAGMSMPSQPANDQAQTPAPPRRRESRRLWREILRPAWKAAVKAGQVANLAPAAVAFEKHLLDEEDHGRNFVFDDGEALQKEVFWQGGYAQPRTLDAAKAEAIGAWAAERRTQILAWGATSPRAEVRNAASRLALRWNAAQPDAGPASRTIEKDVAAQRALFYRRILGAWQFLLAVNDQPAIDRLHALTALERTPLPR